MGFCLLASLSSPARAKFFSTMIGGGLASGDRIGKNLNTLHNYGMFRLATSIHKKHPLFASIDIETLRIQRDENLLPDHHYGEAGGFSLGVRDNNYAVWFQAMSGRLRTLLFTADGFEDKGKRYAYQSTALGASYPVYKRTYSSVDLQLIHKLMIVERGWKNTYGYKNLQMTSLVFSFTLHDI